MSIYLNTIGLKIILDVGVNIDAATLRQIKYIKPCGTLGFWSAQKESSTSISYTTASASDLNTKGTWKLQAYIETSAWTSYGNVTEMIIKETL